MRGKLYATEGVPLKYRITPADAGKTAMLSSSKPACRDHPRGCGENSKVFFYNADALGSPPRMRGKPVAKQLRHRRVGITPADAGKTYNFLALTQCR